MWLNTMRFISLLCTALALCAAMAHVFELPNKIILSKEHYAVVQQIYKGWALLGIAVVMAIISTLAVVIMVRHRRKVFSLTLIALLCIVATQIIFWVWTYPVNQQTINWTILPANWLELRRQWEYSHAVSAGFDLIALSTLVLSLLVTDD
jgi:predicted neutral ceramidase superfamily lipid hydrolase